VYDFRRIALFCLEKRLSKHKMTIFSKNFGGHSPFGPPLATPMALTTEISCDKASSASLNVGSEMIRGPRRLTLFFCHHCETNKLLNFALNYIHFYFCISQCLYEISFAVFVLLLYFSKKLLFVHEFIFIQLLSRTNATQMHHSPKLCLQRNSEVQ